MTSDESQNTGKEVELVGRGKEGDQKKPGKLIIRYTQTRNLNAL